MSIDKNLSFLENVEQSNINTLENIVSTDLERAIKEEELESIKQDRVQRKNFATKIFWVVVVYIAAVLTILVFYGRSCLGFSDAVLITLLSTTTANVLSLLVIVFNYLFPNKGKSIVVK